LWWKLVITVSAVIIVCVSCVRGTAYSCPSWSSCPTNTHIFSGCLHSESL